MAIILWVDRASLPVSHHSMGVGVVVEEARSVQPAILVEIESKIWSDPRANGFQRLNYIVGACFEVVPSAVDLS